MNCHSVAANGPMLVHVFFVAVDRVSSQYTDVSIEFESLATKSSESGVKRQICGRPGRNMFYACAGGTNCGPPFEQANV